MEEIINFISNPQLFPRPVFIIFQIIRIVFSAVSIFLIIMLIFLLTRNRYIENRFLQDATEFKAQKPYQKVKIVKDWEKIMKQVKNGDESEKKLAVIEADDMVYDMVRKLGYKGEKLEEMLEKENSDIIPNIEDLKRAHKRRRDIVYDPGYTLTKEEAEEVMAIYEKTFKDLQFF